MNSHLIPEVIVRFAPECGPVIAAAAWALLHFIWQGCVLAAAYFFAACVLRRASASSRYIAGCVTLLMMAITPLATFAWMLQTGSPEPPASSTPGDAAVASDLVGASSISSLHIGIVGTWLLGMAGCAFWVLGGWAHAQRFRSLPSLPMPGAMHASVLRLGRAMNVRCVVKVVDHFSVAAPLTFGAIKPVILLPASMLLGLSPSQLEAIIAHEMAHIRRRDYLVNLLQTVVESLLFYHPAVWWVSNQVRQEREYCCDDLATQVCGNAIDYARALAQLESLRSDSPRLGLSSQGGSLMKRIARLIGSPPAQARSRLHATTWGMGATLTLLAAASTALAVGRPAEKPVAAEKPVVQEVVGQPLAVQGVWLLQNAVPAEGSSDAVLLERALVATDLTEGEWLAEGVDLFAEAVTQEAAPEAINVLSSRLRVADVEGALFVQCPPVIDPEKMPSNGLVKAAQLAYPYNLLQLMPWVAPEAHDVFVASAAESAAPRLANLAWVESRAATITVTGRPLNVVKRVAATPGVQLLLSDELIAAPSTVDLFEVVRPTGDVHLEYAIEPLIVEFRGDVQIQSVPQAVPATEAVPAQPAKPVETPKP